MFLHKWTWKLIFPKTKILVKGRQVFHQEFSLKKKSHSFTKRKKKRKMESKSTEWANLHWPLKMRKIKKYVEWNEVQKP